MKCKFNLQHKRIYSVSFFENEKCLYFSKNFEVHMHISIPHVEFQLFACKTERIRSITLYKIKRLLKSKDLKFIHSLNKLSTCHVHSTKCSSCGACKKVKENKTQQFGGTTKGAHELTMQETIRGKVLSQRSYLRM